MTAHTSAMHLSASSAVLSLLLVTVVPLQAEPSMPGMPGGKLGCMVQEVGRSTPMQRATVSRLVEASIREWLTSANVMYALGNAGINQRKQDGVSVDGLRIWTDSAKESISPSDIRTLDLDSPTFALTNGVTVGTSISTAFGLLGEPDLGTGGASAQKGQIAYEYTGDAYNLYLTAVDGTITEISVDPHPHAEAESFPRPPLNSLPRKSLPER